MIGVLKKAFNALYFRSELRKDLALQHKRLLWEAHENNSLQFLLTFLGPDQYFPRTNMAMSSVEIRHILNEIVINNRRFIVEFGSGVSTVFIAKLLKEIKSQAKFYSIESDKGWIDIVREQVKKYGADQNVAFIYAPITDQQFLFRDQPGTFKWFNADIIKDQVKPEKVDLVIVDAPMASLCPYSRYPAVPFIKSYLSDSFSVFLDDTDRHQEQIILQEWTRELNAEVKNPGERYALFSSRDSFISQP